MALRWADDQVELSVADTGVGIPATELAYLFDRFHRVKGARSRTHEGTGIGLALVQELIHAHGGTVRVESHEGQGSTFFVTVKTGCAHLPPDRLGAPRSAAPSTGPASPSSARRRSGRTPVRARSSAACPRSRPAG